MSVDIEEVKQIVINQRKWHSDKTQHGYRVATKVLEALEQQQAKIKNLEAEIKELREAQEWISVDGRCINLPVSGKNIYLYSECKFIKGEFTLSFKSGHEAFWKSTKSKKRNRDIKTFDKWIYVQLPKPPKEQE